LAQSLVAVARQVLRGSGGYGHQDRRQHDGGERLLLHHHVAPPATHVCVSHARLRSPPAGSHARVGQSARPRSSSLIEVFDRVLASTCLTITAQYSECDRSFAGSWPETTTL